MRKPAVTLGVAILLLLPALPVQAQIGRGWVEYFPRKTLQQENSVGYSTYSDSNGIESFTLRRNATGSRQRCEIRIHDDYTTGVTQFQGEFLMVKGGGPSYGDDVAIMQVWLTLIVSASAVNNGTIQDSHKTLIDGFFGKWVRLNVYHNADTRLCEIWFDGVKKASRVSKDSNPFYHKYGLYNQAGSNPEIKYRNVRFFKGGTMEGGLVSDTKERLLLPREKPGVAKLMISTRNGNPTLIVQAPQGARGFVDFNLNGSAFPIGAR